MMSMPIVAAQGTRKNNFVVQHSRSHGDHDDISRARVRAYEFGRHIKPSVGAGKLIMVNNGAEDDFNVVKGLLLMALEGAPAMDRMDYSNVHLYLLPDGELISSSGVYNVQALPNKPATCVRLRKPRNRTTTRAGCRQAGQAFSPA